MSRGLLTAALLVHLLATTGCSIIVDGSAESGPAAELAGDDAMALRAGEGTLHGSLGRGLLGEDGLHGTVVVERTLAADGRAEPQARVSARFMRHEGMGRHVAERLVATRRFQPDADFATECIWTPVDPVARPTDVASAPDGGTIELLDVGDIVVRTWDHEDPPVGPSTIDSSGAFDTSLVTRAFPDVGDLVSGVVYTSRDDSWLPEADGYAFDVEGSDEVEAFRLRFDTPRVPAEVAIDGVPFADLDALVRGETVELTWAAVAAEDDDFYISVVPVDGGDGPGYRCVVDDARGAAAVTLPFLEGGRAIDIEVHRYRRRDVRLSSTDGSPDIAAATVEVDVATATRVTLTE
ncbi:MAG: hypothetical protein AAF715_27455 [Myxococcota bacterium]